MEKDEAWIHRRLKNQGKPDKVARTAAARKLLVIAAGKELRRNSEATQLAGLPIYPRAASNSEIRIRRSLREAVLNLDSPKELVCPVPVDQIRNSI